MDDLAPWRDAVDRCCREAGQTPVRRVRWVKGSSCTYSRIGDVVGVGRDFAVAHSATSSVAHGVLVHELGHRFFRHRFELVWLAVTASGVVAAAAGAAVVIAVQPGRTPWGVLVLVGIMVLSWCVGYGTARRVSGRTTKRWEHQADDYATSVVGADSLAAIATYAPLTGAARWLSSHPDPSERTARQQARLLAR